MYNLLINSNMPLTKEMINQMKEVEHNINDYIKLSMEKQEQKFNLTMEKVFKRLKAQEIAIDKLKKSQTFINNEFENIKQMVDELKSTDLDTEVKLLENKVMELQKDLEKESKLRDELEQYGKQDNLEFHGICVLPNENTN